MKKHPDSRYAVGRRRYADGSVQYVSRFVLPAALLLWLLLLNVAPADAANKVMPFDPAGLASLVGAIPAPTPTTQLATAPVPAPALPAASQGLTLDRFALGFGLIVIGVIGAALARRAMRSARTSVSAPPTEKKSPPPS
jgi:hypothetical protein